MAPSGHILAVSGGWTGAMWAWLVVPIAIYTGITLLLFALGRTQEPWRSDEPMSLIGYIFKQISDSLERFTGLAGWAMAGALSALMMLGIAVMGFYWDVAWHIDFGRDKNLFTPAHVMILVGLGGLFYAAMVTVLFASNERVETRLRIGWLRFPMPAVLLAAFGAGGVAAFPLDNLWHKAYGIDVTLWSPTHLLLMSGGAFATLAIWLLIAEVLPSGRPTPLGNVIHALAAGAALTGLSIYQGEFDYGVPQFQVVYLPVLIAAAGAFVLVLARIALGRWGAVKAVAAYLILRVLLGLMVGGALGHTFPRFPLYLIAALAVEGAAAWVGTHDRLRFALVAGALLGTVGVAGEMTWVALSYGWSSAFNAELAMKGFVLALAAALGAAVLGAGLGRAFTGPAADEGTGRPTMFGRGGVPAAALVLGGVVLIASFAYPLPRRAGSVSGVVALERQGERAIVDVTLQPTDAADGAIVFAVTSWQGGGTVHAELHEIGPGHYRTTTAVPVIGSWKSMVSLERGDEVMAAPIYLPADPAIGAPAVPALPQRDVTFVRNTTILLREVHDGPAGPAVLAYSGLAGLMALWVFLLAVDAVRTPETSDRGTDSAVPPGGSAPPVPKAPAPPPDREPAPQLATSGGWYVPGAGPSS